jgi:hypothetical protein
MVTYSVSKADFRNPNGANDVCPSTIVSLLESPSFVRTKDTVDGSRRTLEASSTQPLPLWNVRNSIALLMYCQITHIAKEDRIAILALSIHADTANGIVVYHGTPVHTRALHLQVTLLFQPVHEQFQDVDRDWIHLSPFTASRRNKVTPIRNSLLQISTIFVRLATRRTIRSLSQPLLVKEIKPGRVFFIHIILNFLLRDVTLHPPNIGIGHGWSRVQLILVDFTEGGLRQLDFRAFAFRLITRVVG